MWNNTNPAELFSGTTWELIIAGKYIQSGSTALSTGGSNSISITKANLPAVKIQLESFSVTTQKHEHMLCFHREGGEYFDGGNKTVPTGSEVTNKIDNMEAKNKALPGGGDNTGIASPYTQNLGSGTAISINPTYITLKFWKRLT